MEEPMDARRASVLLALAEALAAGTRRPSPGTRVAATPKVSTCSSDRLGGSPCFFA